MAKDIINSILQQSNVLGQENHQFSNLHDWLLPMLMNGQVTVGKAYEQVEEVLSMVAEDETFYANQIKATN